MRKYVPLREISKTYFSARLISYNGLDVSYLVKKTCTKALQDRHLQLQASEIHGFQTPMTF